MQGIDRGFRIKGRRMKRAVGCFSALLFLFFLASGAYADQVCSDCHDTSQHSRCDAGNCAACHGNPPVDAGGLIHPYAAQTNPVPSGAASAGAHARHGTSSGYSFPCSACHFGGMSAASGQLVGGANNGNGVLQMGFSVPIPGGVNLSGGAYDGVAGLAYPYEATNGTIVTTGGTNTCSSIYCHSDGTSISTGIIPAGISSPAWDTTSVPLACDQCHGFPPSYVNGTPKANSHMTAGHLKPCNVCHYQTTNDGTTLVVSPAVNSDGVYNVDPDASATFNGVPVSFNYSYDADGGSCSAVSCHGGIGLVWGQNDVSGISCTLCHTAMVQSEPGQNHHSGTCLTCHDTGTPDGRARHDETPPSTANSACVRCHTGINQDVNHHAGTCTTCHTEPGVHQYGTTNTACRSCHSDKDIATKMAHPHNTSAPQNCIQCHTEPGGPVGTTGCLVCHTAGVPSYSYTLHLVAPNLAPTGCETNFTPVVYPTGSKTVMHQDASSDPGDASAFAYMNWGDGSPIEKRAIGYTFTHTYAYYGNYNIYKTVKDGAGASCVVVATVAVPDPAVVGGDDDLTIATTKQAGVCSKYPTSVTTRAQCTAVGGVWTAPPPDFSYTYELRQGGLTKKTGTGNTSASTLVTGLTAGTYNVYLTYPSGHICTYANGTAVAIGATTTATACR